jgi:hypothetical protein
VPAWKAKPRNQCALCFREFASVRAFDLHKTGTHEHTFAEGLRRDPPREDGRRCLDEDEMRARPKGRLDLNARGLWEEVDRADRARSRFGTKAD